VKILTTLRRVPDLDARIALNADKTKIETAALEHKLNYFDEVAIEEALRLKERGAGVTEIVVVCIGSADATKELRTALAMGADRAILVKADERQLDPMSVARILSEVVEREQPDLILMGKLGVDFENNQTAQILAGLRDLPQATFAYKLEAADGAVTVGREVDGGTVTYKLPLPAVVTADLRLNEPRFPSLPNIMGAKRKPLQELTLSDLGVEATAVVQTVRFELPPERKAGVKVASVEELVAKLRNEVKAL
jgi:electron transfer flavoprotein beta subunit